MSSFSMVLLEEGVEMEIPASMSEALGLLDEVVPTFSCLDYGYRLGVVTRAQLKSNWAFRVQLMDAPSQQLIDDPVGCIELAKVDDYTVNLKVPPRSEQDFPGIVKYDGDGRYYGSFIFQLLNNLYDRSLIELPGALPRL